MVPGVFKKAIASQISRRFPRLWIEREMRYRPNHFEPELWLVPVLCEPDKTSIDVGANMGIYSYYMMKHSRKVVLFEPNIDLWPHLRRVLGADCELIGTALSSRSSSSTLRLDRQNTGVATIEQNNDLSCVSEKSSVVSRAVETRALDSFEFSDVALIKIDVEGHEESAIEGSKNTISRNRPAFIIESENRHNPGAPHRLANTMSSLNYRGFYLQNSRLFDLSDLCEDDLNPENLSTGLRPYVNNFIFIAKEQEAKLQRLKSFLAKSKS